RPCVQLVSGEIQRLSPGPGGEGKRRQRRYSNYKCPRYASVAWRLVLQSICGRAFRHPLQECAGDPAHQCRLPSGEDFYALTALRLYHAPKNASQRTVSDPAPASRRSRCSAAALSIMARSSILSLSPIKQTSPCSRSLRRRPSLFDRMTSLARSSDEEIGV